MEDILPWISVAFLATILVVVVMHYRKPASQTATASEDSGAPVLAKLEQISDHDRRQEGSLDTALKAVRDQLHKTGEGLARLDARTEALHEPLESLRFVFSDNKRRGIFGEQQLQDLVEDLFPNHAQFEETLKSGHRADCVIRFPGPPWALAIDAKFPVNDFIRWSKAEGAERDNAGKNFSNSVTKMIKDIAEKYIAAGETADCALMFVPSESVFAALHTDFDAVISASRKHRVWLVSPSTLGAVLTTLRASLSGFNLLDKAPIIRTHMDKTLKELKNLEDRLDKLQRHYEAMGKDFHQVEISRGKLERAGEALRDLQTGREGSESESGGDNPA